MQQYYKLVIKDGKFESYRKLASFLFLINALVFAAQALRTVSVSGKIILFTASFLLLAYAVYNWKYKKKKERSFILIYLLIALIWITDTPFWYFSVIFLALLLLQLRMESELTISLSPEKVTVNAFLRKEHSWSELNHVVLKDGLLTLDFKNNRVLQVYPDWNASVEDRGIESWEPGEGFPETEKEFNEFCEEHLQQATPGSV